MSGGGLPLGNYLIFLSFSFSIIFDQSQVLNQRRVDEGIIAPEVGVQKCKQSLKNAIPAPVCWFSVSNAPEGYFLDALRRRGQTTVVAGWFTGPPNSILHCCLLRWRLLALPAVQLPLPRPRWHKDVYLSISPSAPGGD